MCAEKGSLLCKRRPIAAGHRPVIIQSDLQIRHEEKHNDASSHLLWRIRGPCLHCRQTRSIWQFSIDGGKCHVLFVLRRLRVPDYSTIVPYGSIWSDASSQRHDGCQLFEIYGKKCVCHSNCPQYWFKLCRDRIPWEVDFRREAWFLVACWFDSYLLRYVSHWS